MAGNTWEVAIFRYGEGVIDWKESELSSIDRKTRKTLTMYGAMHPKSDVDRLYITRKEGGRGLSSIKYSVKGEENSLGYHVANTEETLMRGVRVAGTIKPEGTVNSNELKNQRAEESKKKF